MKVNEKGSFPETREEILEALKAKDYLFDGATTQDDFEVLATCMARGIKTCDAYNPEWRDTIKVLDMQDSCACVVGWVTQPEWLPAQENEADIDPWNFGEKVLARTEGTLDDLMRDDPYDDEWAVARAFNIKKRDPSRRWMGVYSFDALQSAWLVVLGKAS